MSIRNQVHENSEPLLKNSKLLDAVLKSIVYAQENGGIGLTKGRAFNRKFSTWAAENFNWPEYSAMKLLRIQKVLDEIDVVPVYVLHELLVSMRFGRHVKGVWKFNKEAETLATTPGKLQHELTKGFLFEFDHTKLQRYPFVAPGNWDIWLNIINIEAHGGVSEASLLKTFYGVECVSAGDREFWNYASFLSWHVLKPLSWLGYLEETELDGPLSPMDRTIWSKTALWQRTFSLDTDEELGSYTLH